MTRAKAHLLDDVVDLMVFQNHRFLGKIVNWMLKILSYQLVETDLFRLRRLIRVYRNVSMLCFCPEEVTKRQMAFLKNKVC